MGLDMYLLARKSKQTDGRFLEVGYWRKVNSVHAWFVNRCGNGVDECQLMKVETEDLRALLALCEEVLEDHSKAVNLLPTQKGFFFGSQDYDEWYFEDIKDTKDIVTTALELSGYEIFYQASW